MNKEVKITPYYPDMYIDIEMEYLERKRLQQENKQLKDNWNKLEKELWNLRNVSLTKEFGNEWKECLSFNNDILPIIKEMQELEDGDSNE